MNEEETPAMEFVQHMEYTAVHGVRRLLVFVNYFSNVSPCLSQKTKTNLKEKLFKDMTVIQYWKYKKMLESGMCRKLPEVYKLYQHFLHYANTI